MRSRRSISLGYLGMMLGGAIAGLVGDRFGRRVALLGSMLVFGVMTMAVAAVDGVAALGVLRFLTGLGLGGAIPNAAALAAEFVPVRQRALAVTMTIVCVPLGATLAGLVAIPLLPAVGLARAVPRRRHPAGRRRAGVHVAPARVAAISWRGIRRVGASSSHRCVAWDSWSTRTRHSSTRARNRPSHASLASSSRRSSALDTLALWAAFFSCLLAVYLGFSWVPSMLTGAGFASSVASTGITAFNLGGVAGALAGGVCITRWGSRRLDADHGGLAVASAASMGAMRLAPRRRRRARSSPCSTITGALINGVQTTMYALAAHVYPAIVRATGVGAAVSFGRIGAVLSGYVGAWALEYRGAASFFAVIAAAMGLSCIALATVRRHVPGEKGDGSLFSRR